MESGFNHEHSPEAAHSSEENQEHQEPAYEFGPEKDLTSSYEQAVTRPDSPEQYKAEDISAERDRIVAEFMERKIDLEAIQAKVQEILHESAVEAAVEGKAITTEEFEEITATVDEIEKNLRVLMSGKQPTMSPRLIREQAAAIQKTQYDTPAH